MYLYFYIFIFLYFLFINSNYYKYLGNQLSNYKKIVSIYKAMYKHAFNDIRLTKNLYFLHILILIILRIFLSFGKINISIISLR
jgi:hypothetical protein